MKKTFKKSLSLLVATILVATTFLISPMTASAICKPDEVLKLDFWVAVEDGATTGGDLGTVQAHSRSNSSGSTYYLFLPTNADKGNLTVFFSASSASYNGTSLTSGQPTSAFNVANGTTATLNLGGTTYSLCVYQSGQVGTVYVNCNDIASVNSSSSHTYGASGTVEVANADGIVEYSGGLDKIQGRGNGTWSTSNTKNPYNLKLTNSTSLLGMNKAKKWVLLANTQDPTLVKNQLTYDFSDEIGVEYQGQMKPVDFYVNGNYYGSYMLAEKVEIKSNRINLESDAYDALEIANGTIDSFGTVTPADFAEVVPSVGTYDSSGSSLSSGSILQSALSSAGHTVGARKYSNSLISPSDITGGYLYELEISQRWVDNNAGFCGYNRQGWVVKNCDYASKDMVNYSYELLYALGSSVYNSGIVPSSSTTTSCGSLSKTIAYGSSSVTNPAPSTTYQGKKWSDILDADSAVKYYWTQEFFKNMDSSTSSTYFYKDSDSVDSMLYAGPVWDMDNTMASSGSRWGYSYGSSTGWYTKNTRIYRWRTNDSDTSYSTDSYAPLSFYAALAKQPDFWEMASNYWHNTVSPATDILLGNKTPSSTSRLKTVEEYVNTVAQSAAMNALRLDLSSYDANSSITTLKTWISERQTWINGEISQVDINSASVPAISAKQYTGNEIKPSFTVNYSSANLGTLTLEEGVDYEVESYSNNVNVGTATIVIKGIGYYTGTKTINFTISRNNYSTSSATLPVTAYKGDTLIPSVTNIDGANCDLSACSTVKWYCDGTLIDAANSYSFTVDDSYAGSSIYAVITGDGICGTGILTTNSCAIANETRPSGLIKNIATFSYKYGDDGTSLAGSKTDGYSATGGTQKSTAKLFGSVNGTTNSKIEWSGDDTFTCTDGTTGQQPIIAPSTTTPWQEAPYFDVKFSTDGYTNVAFSCDIGATKKGSKYYAIMYSTDGTNFDYIYNAEEDDYLWYEFAETENKTMKTAFDLTLPSACDNQENVTVRIVVDENYTLDGADTFYTTTNTSGKIAINNIEVDAVAENDITSISKPVFSTTNTSLYNDEKVGFEAFDIGATIYYTLTDENNNVSDIYTYSNQILPFDMINSNSKTCTITAWAEYGIYVSDQTVVTLNSKGDRIESFALSNYPETVNGSLQSTDGVYGQSGILTTATDSTIQYPVRYNAEKSAISISPDDGLLWRNGISGFTTQFTTAGYSDITFSCDAFTTSQGPKSLSMYYSLNGTNWTVVDTNKPLSANGVLESYYDCFALPSECNNQKVVFVKLVATENLTNGGAVLFDNYSKGNLYFNNINIGGTQSGILMPYTNKSTNYYGTSGSIKYNSPDGLQMLYSIVDSNNNVVSGGAYTSAIKFYELTGWNARTNSTYTVNIYCKDDEGDTSFVNSKTYYYKGNTISAFSYSTDSGDANNYLNYFSTDSTEVTSLNGNGTISMYPNGTSKTALGYTNSYGIKATATESNTWTSSKKLNEPDTSSTDGSVNGYWLIKTSTTGYTSVILNLKQVTSGKGPRDWGLAYSLNGTSFTYIENTNRTAVSTASPTELYSSVALPSACDNQETVYIKLFINGGENLDGYELYDASNGVGKGNTGLGDVEISGIPEATYCNVSSKVVMMETTNGSAPNNLPVSNATVTLDGENEVTTLNDGTFTFENVADGTHRIVISTPYGPTRNVLLICSGEDISYGAIPVVVVDCNKDGIINSRDLTAMSKLGIYNNNTKTIVSNFTGTTFAESDYKNLTIQTEDLI